MLIKIKLVESDAVNVSPVVKDITKMKNIKKTPSPHPSNNLIIAFERTNKSLPFLDEKLLEGVLKANSFFVQK